MMETLVYLFALAFFVKRDARSAYLLPILTNGPNNQAGSSAHPSMYRYHACALALSTNTGSQSAKQQPSPSHLPTYCLHLG